MNEIMYEQSSILIVGVLFAILIVATELGYRLGFRFSADTTDAAKTQINTIQGSLLGVLALLLGFTFSLALQRFDTRSEAVIGEANAIGTTILRAGLLPDSVRANSQELLRQYLDQRVRAGTIPLDRPQERASVLRESDQILDALWVNALRAAEEDGNPVRTGLYVQALNQMIDAYGIRDAALDRHVPEPVLFLMFMAFLLAASLVGYAAGVSARRTSLPTFVLVTLVAFLVFMIIDLDRPRRGLIEVSQQSLVDLQLKVRSTD
jgi:hypothetical protein